MDEGRLIDKPGPLRKLFESGGTVLLNEAGFTDKQLEALNEIKMDALFRGTKVSRSLRVISIIDADKKMAGTRSPALISRAHYIKIPNSALSDPKPLSVESSKAPDVNSTVFDCASHDWLQLFQDRVIKGKQGWETKEADLPVQLNRGKSVVLRNSPIDDFHFQADFSEWKKKFDDKRLTLTLEEGISQEERTAALANKTAERAIEALLQPDTGVTQEGRSVVWTVNQSNADNFFQSDQYCVVKSEILPLAPILEKAQQGKSTTPTLFVTENLQKAQWDLLMCCKYAFSIAAAKGVDVPEVYKNAVGVTASNRSNMPLTLDETLTQPASIVSSRDPELTSLHLDETLEERGDDYSHIYVTPYTKCNQLTQETRFNRDDKNHISGESRLCQLLNDLKAGRHVILHGLENNPDLQSSLSTLIHPPHYLYENGIRYQFAHESNDTSLDKEHILFHGRLTVLVSESTEENRCALDAFDAFHYSVNEINTQSEHNTAIIERLVKCGHKIGIIEKVMKTVELLNANGPADDAVPLPEINYARIVSLVKTAESIDGPEPGDALRLLKDRFTGDFRHHPEKYARAKVFFKAIWGKATSHGGRHGGSHGGVSEPDLGERSVDPLRLNQVLKRAAQPSEPSPIKWQCLNCFSPALLHEQLEQGQLNEADVLKFLKRYLSGKESDLSHSSSTETPKSIEHRLTRLNEKISSALKNDRAVFLKSAAGLGKTHAIKEIQQAHAHRLKHQDTSSVKTILPVVVDVSNVGEQALHDAIETWALQSSASRLLVIDEANLAPKESLSLLKEVFSQGSVTVNGQRYWLNDNHKILFTGNYDHFEGRTVQEVAHERFNTITLKPFTEAYLERYFVSPVLDKAFSDINLPEVIDRNTLTETLIRLHLLMANTFPEHAFSVRNFEEFIAQMVVQVKEMDREGVLDFPQRLETVLSDLYLERLPIQEKSAVKEWLAHHVSSQFNASKLESKSESTPLSQTFSLKRTSSIVPTASTQALAQRLNRWLTSHKEKVGFNPKPNTLGQRGFLIEGPAGRGKDQLVKAVLEQRKWPENRTTYLNAGSDLTDFSTKVKEAAREGFVLVISEMNLFPSHILEGELNHLLTGDAEWMHSDFCLISTVNPPSYSGREPLSPAILNRMVVNCIEEYSEHEVIEIAEELRAQFQAELSNNIERVSPNRISQDHVKQLAKEHVHLIDETSDAGVATPTTRQLRRAIKDIVENPRSVQEVMETHYDYYQEQLIDVGRARRTSGATSSSDRPLDIKARNEIVRSLALKARLERPGWQVQPTFCEYKQANLPIEYDAATHQMRINFEHPRIKRSQGAGDYLAKELIRMLDEDMQTYVPKGGMLPEGHKVELKGVEPLADVDEVEPSSCKASDWIPWSIKKVGRKIKKSVRSKFHGMMQQTEKTRLKAVDRVSWGTVRAGVNLDPLSVKPTGKTVSGVGAQVVVGYIGEISTAHTLIRSKLTDLNENLIPLNSINNSVQRSSDDGQTEKVTQVELSYDINSIATAKQHKRDVYLKTLPNTFPENVFSVDPQSGERTSLQPEKHRGVWRIKVKRGYTVQYDLLKSKPHTEVPKPSPKPSLTKPVLLDIEQKNKTLYDFLVFLKQEYSPVQRHAEELVDELNKFFKNPDNFTYDRNCTEIYSGCKDNKNARCNQFIAKRIGVCYEYANTFALILEQEFGIPARMVSGHRVVQQQIGREAHAWLEYWDQDSEDWKEVDPTGGEVMDRKPQQIVGTMRIIRSSDLDSAKTEAIKSYSAKYSEELACEGAAHLLPYRDNPEFINRFKRRVDAMNLLGEKSVTPKHRYTTENRGTLDIQRVVEGRLDCFKIRTLEEETQSSPIYLYHTLDSRKWQNEMFQTAFPMPLYPVIDQLVDMGVPLYYMDKGTAIAVKSGASLNKLVAEQLVNDVVQTATVEGEDKTNKGEIHLKDREESDRIFNKLAQIYYQTLAEQISMDRGADPERGDHGVMQEAIYRGSIQIPMMHTLLLPFKIPTAEGEKVLTEMDFDTLSQKLPLDLKNKPVTDEESDLFPINVFSPIVQHRIVQFMELHIDTMKHPFYHKQMLMAYQAAEKVGSDGVKSLVEFKQREAYENIKLRWPLGT